MTARKPTQTVVVDFRIPFWRMVAVMVKLSIASIPAALIIGALFVALNFVIGGLLAGTMVWG